MTTTKKIAEEIDIVIAGGGICGLATALALHRKGIRSLVLERAESLRATGAGIGVLANGWRVLDELGVASKLRPTALPIQRVRDIWLDSGKQREAPLSIDEARCVKRSDLIEALADELPSETIRFASQILSVELETTDSYPIIHLADGTAIRAKVLIGCDGSNSAVADFLGLKPPKLSSSCTVRGFTNYPNGHGVAAELSRVIRGNVFCGRVPVNDKLVFWFFNHSCYPTDANLPKDAQLIRRMALETSTGLPQELRQMIANCDLTSLSFTRLRYRAPWDLPLGRSRRGTVTVAGDAMHVMGPFLGQGGSAAMEDAVVLGRCLAQKIQGFDFGGSEMQVIVQKIGDALDAYVKERRMRVIALSTQTYLTGLLLGTSSVLVKFVIISLMMLLFRNRIGHTRYDCGRL